jgi:hypothetical protein
MAVETRKLFAIGGGLIFCAVWIAVLAFLCWVFLDANALIAGAQALLALDGEGLSYLVTRIAALFIASTIPAYWLYAGAVGVIEDYGDYRKLTEPLSRYTT